MRPSLPILALAIVLVVVYLAYYVWQISVYSWNTIIPLFYFVATFLAFIAIYLRVGEVGHGQASPP